MSTKTITIMDDAYDVLSKNKMDGESFSDTIRRICSKKGEIDKYFGVWNKNFAESVEKSIIERRDLDKKRNFARD